jgi:LacI family transcriptional regulator
MAKSATPTSTDVARQAGVSQATVSGVLNGTNIRVSDATRVRVLAAAAELGYAPHPAAQALRRRRSGAIGFVPRAFRGTPYEHPVPYHLSIHIARAALGRGWHVVEASAETANARGGGELIQFLLGRRVDGVIFDWPESADEVRHVLDRGVPVVQVIRPQFAAATPTVTVDAAPGIGGAIDHLVALGHRRIAFLGDRGAHPTDRSRLDSFKVALARHGLAVPGEYVCLVTNYASEEGAARTRALLALPRRPTALFAASDSLAIGALHALYEARVHVPDALSLISYDDLFAPHLYPRLTSVAQPLEEVAERAVALLAAQVEQREEATLEPARLALPTRLVVRQSTQVPAAEAREQEGGRP